MFRQHTIALALAASFALTGCGAQSVATLATAPMQQAPALNGNLAAAPSVSISHGAQLVANNTAGRQHTLGVVRLVGEDAMSDDDLADDALSQGYSVASVAEAKVEKKFSKTGIVRRTATGYALETSKGLFKSKKNDTFTLTGTPTILSDLAKRENRKALVKGSVDQNNVVTVTSVKGLADMGFLTNWFSKGKITGTIHDGNGQAVDAVEVDAKSADGFVFHALSEADGSFEIKSLTPGSYSVSFHKTGFVDTTGSADVKKRTNEKLVVTLPAEPAPAPATGNN